MTLSTYADCAIVVDVYMDKSFVNKNGVPNSWQTRIDELTTSLHGLFGGGFGIGLSFNFTLNNTRLVTSPADECVGITLPGRENICSCYTNAQCAKSSTYHHTNYHRVRSECLGNPSSNTIELLLTAHNYCRVSNGSHGTVFGVCFPNKNQLICMDYDLEDGKDNDIDYYYARATIVHELGHLYGVEDHYGNGTPDGENDDCIWGDNRKRYEVSKDIKICTTCYNTIKANRTKYDQ